MSKTLPMPPRVQITAKSPMVTMPVNPNSDRRSDVEQKQLFVAQLLAEHNANGLLISDPANFSWLTSGGVARGAVDSYSQPCLYFSAEARWLLSANVDTLRLFDEEINGMGFQIKEWPWYLEREQLLRDLTANRSVLADFDFVDCKNISQQLQQMRSNISSYEEACYRVLGEAVGTALETTCRECQTGETERDVAGRLSYLLIKRGVIPLNITVMADGRNEVYRQGGFTPTKLKDYATIIAVGQKYGLAACASRTVVFGNASPELQADHDAACRVAAIYVAGSWPNSLVKDILNAGRGVYQATNAHFEWQAAPQGYLTGRSPVEQPFLVDSTQILKSTNAVIWRASVRKGLSCDTFLVDENGPRTVTTIGQWPLKKIRVHGAEYVRPDILYRNEE